MVASRLPGRIGKQCRERWFNHLDPSIKKGEWSPEEDRIVFGAQASLYTAAVKASVSSAWDVCIICLASVVKLCLQVYVSLAGENFVFVCHLSFNCQAYMGNRWCEIAKLLPGRTENAVKNRFNSSARKKWLDQNPGGASQLTPDLLNKVCYDDNGLLSVDGACVCVAYAVAVLAAVYLAIKIYKGSELSSAPSFMLHA